MLTLSWLWYNEKMIGWWFSYHVGAFGNIGGLNHCVVLCVAHLQHSTCENFFMVVLTILYNYYDD